MRTCFAFREDSRDREETETLSFFGPGLPVFAIWRECLQFGSTRFRLSLFGECCVLWLLLMASAGAGTLDAALALARATPPRASPGLFRHPTGSRFGGSAHGSERAGRATYVPGTHRRAAASESFLPPGSVALCVVSRHRLSGAWG